MENIINTHVHQIEEELLHRFREAGNGAIDITMDFNGEVISVIPIAYKDGVFEKVNIITNTDRFIARRKSSNESLDYTDFLESTNLHDLAASIAGYEAFITSMHKLERETAQAYFDHGPSSIEFQACLADWAYNHHFPDIDDCAIVKEWCKKYNIQ